MRMRSERREERRMARNKNILFNHEAKDENEKTSTERLKEKLDLPEPLSTKFNNPVKNSRNIIIDANEKGEKHQIDEDFF